MISWLAVLARWQEENSNMFALHSAIQAEMQSLWCHPLTKLVMTKRVRYKTVRCRILCSFGELFERKPIFN